MTLSYFKNPVKFETAHAHLWFSVFSQKALTLLLPFNCLIPINWYSRSCQYILCGSNWAQQNCTSIDLSNENVFYQKKCIIYQYVQLCEIISKVLQLALFPLYYYLIMNNKVNAFFLCLMLTNMYSFADKCIWA